MIFWLAVAVLAATVTYAVTRPLLGEPGQADGAREADLAVYKDQLAEIDADALRGMISDTEAQAARAEVARRVLRHADASPAEGDGGAAGSGLPNVVYLGASAVLPLASLAIYLMYGTPGLPGAPLKERLAAPVAQSGVQDLIAKVEARLRSHPEDGKGWDVIAPVYMKQQRFADAAEAYATAIKILGETPRRLLGFSEARIRVSDGVIPDDARKALQSVLAIEPKNFEARIWLAIAKEEDGDKTGATSDFKALIAEAPDGAPWRGVIENRLAALEGRPAAPASGSGGDGAPANGGAANVESMSPAERQAMIEGMVARLAEKLKTNSKDKVGWLRLIRAYQVMGRKDDAAKAVAEAKAGLAGDEQAIGEIDALAKDLGIGG